MRARRARAAGQCAHGFWLPLLLGAVAFMSLRQSLNDPERPELCVVAEAS